MGKVTARKEGDHAVFHDGAHLPVRHRPVLDVYFLGRWPGPAAIRVQHSVPHGKLVATFK